MPKRTRDGRFLIMYNNGAAQYMEAEQMGHLLPEAAEDDEEVGYEVIAAPDGPYESDRKRRKLDY